MVGVAVIETLIASKEEDIKIGSQIYYFIILITTEESIGLKEEGGIVELFCHT
jgi:hypothetical protein